ncbi:MAG: hypothetical protein KC609_25470 [Myxococcales bacterium]|nr:hypothetical protein [Myxococcales bacterium]
MQRKVDLGFRGALVLLFVLGSGLAVLAHSSAENVISRFDSALTMGKVGRSCTFKGKRLWGKVQVVTSFPDFRVKVTNSFPDLKVKRVTSFADKCGLWHYVTSFPDFKIQFVTSFPDFTIQYVTSFPGVP